MKANLKKISVLSVCALSLNPLAIAVVNAQQSDATDVEAVEEVIVTGSRGRPRTVIESAVPVDVFNTETLESVSYTDTNDVLQTLVPSYSVSRNPISDGGTFIRPASMRGLPTDKTLVLVNSKRRHRAALVSIGGSGTQGPDVSTIPTAAIKNVEVLRDGAAAQYGSDAIAGVINFILKDNAQGASLSIDTGQHTEGDGAQTTVQGNIGLPLGGAGFLSLSGEYYDQEATSRSEQYCESWFCLDPTNPVYDPTAAYAQFVEDPAFVQAANQMAREAQGANVVQPWGQPNTSALRMFFNAGIPLADGSELYAFGNYSASDTDGGFFYRYPNNGTIEDLRRPDGSIYSPLEKHPGGFTPRFKGDVYDHSLAAGWRGEWNSGLGYDLSARLGESSVEYTLMNTINPSLGPDSPVSFRPGDLVNTEMQLQADFTLELNGFDTATAPLLAFGASYMDEEYKIIQGELSSYVAGPYASRDPFDLCAADGTPTSAGTTAINGGSTLDCADADDPVYQVVGVGSNGFPGNSPQFSEDYTRDSFGIYGDLSADITDRLFLQGAMRYEDYSDFGSELVGKLAGRFAISQAVALRGSIGTGFRAPTPGQQGTTNVSTRLPDGFPVATGLFPASGPVAQALGATPLKPETSMNYTLGMTFDLPLATLTVDYYRIDLEDRFNSISTRPVSADPTAAGYDNFLALSNAGVAGAETIGGVFYFTNAFDTRTEGVDVVANVPLDWDNAGSTTFTASFNYNVEEYTSNADLLNQEEQYDFLNESRWRAVFSANHRIGPFSVLGRLNAYGPSSNFQAGRVQDYPTEALFDLEAQYDVTQALNITVGGRNIFDNYPPVDRIGDFCCGRVYSSGTPISWQGAYYFGRLRYDF